MSSLFGPYQWCGCLSHSFLVLSKKKSLAHKIASCRENQKNWKWIFIADDDEDDDESRKRISVCWHNHNSSYWCLTRVFFIHHDENISHYSLYYYKKLWYWWTRTIYKSLFLLNVDNFVFHKRCGCVIYNKPTGKVLYSMIIIAASQCGRQYFVIYHWNPLLRSILPLGMR